MKDLRKNLKKTLKWIAPLALAFSQALAVTTAFAGQYAVTNGIPNLHIVIKDQIIRGGRPTEEGIQWLGQTVKTVIDFEDDEQAVDTEKQAAEAQGLTFVSLPLHSQSTPSDDQIDKILSAIASAQQPVFVHCHHGDDRTGLVVALYRVKYQHWSPADAFNEMISDGFLVNSHPALLAYFGERTGYSPGEMQPEQKSEQKVDQKPEQKTEQPIEDCVRDNLKKK